MASLYGGHDHYRRMFELQDKLRKSEEERIRLEERFNVLVQDSRNRHDACISRLRMKYIQYLEEQRTRDERNHKLLTALDKVMNKLALISAKKDRLNVLRKQYEAHLLRVYANRRAPGSVTGDSGIASQNEDKYTKKIAAAQPDFAETGSVSSPRAWPAPHPVQPRSIRATKFHDQPAVNGTSLNNPPIFLPTPADASLDYRQANVVPRASQGYVSPIDRSSDRPVRQLHPQAIAVSDARPYSHTIPIFDGTASRGLQDIPRVNVPYDTVSSSSQRIRPDEIPVNRFFKEHVEAIQSASGLSRFPVEKTARYEETSPTPRQFLSLTSFPCHDAASPSSPRSQIREYDLIGAAGAIGPTSVTAKSSVYRIGDVGVADHVDPLPGYMDYALMGSEDEGSVRSLTSDDIDDLMRRDERVLWTNADVTGTPRRSPAASADVKNSTASPLDENGRTTAVLENELDRYISNIRKLHREHGVPSPEELDHEQNTSGDLLNVTLSEDALELPAEERARNKERAPEEMDKVLALADDLVTRTADLKEIARDKDERDGDNKSSAVDKIRRRHDASNGETRKGHETSVTSEIREDVAKHSTELERLAEDAEIVKERSWNNADDSIDAQKRNQEAEKIDTKKETSADNRPEADRLKNIQEKRDLLDFVTGVESDIEGLFDIAEQLEPWDIASVEKQIREMRLDNLDEDRETARKIEETTDAIDKEMASESRGSPQLTEETYVKQNGKTEKHAQDTLLPQTGIKTRTSDTNERNEGNEDAVSSQAPSCETSNETQHQNTKTDDPAVASHIIEKPGELSDDRAQDNGETTRSEIVDRPEKIHEYGAEDPSQAQQYEQQNPNEQHHYEQNTPYEETEEYDRYADQGYAREGQEYVEYVDGQYEQYSGDPDNQQYQEDPNAQYDPNSQQYQQDPNAQYDPNSQQYQQDPNAQYDPNSQQYQQDPNAQYDPNSQQYQQDPNAQYDPNNQQQYEQDPNRAYDYNYDPNQEYSTDPSQGYGADPNNQAYDYTEQVPYDPNQIYDNTVYDQQYTEEQRAAEEGVVYEETPKAGETSQREQADPERKSDRDENKPREEDVKTTNQSKKKKDVIKSLLDSDTDTTTIERNASNTESDFDFN